MTIAVYMGAMVSLCGRTEVNAIPQHDESQLSRAAALKHMHLQYSLSCTQFRDSYFFKFEQLFAAEFHCVYNCLHAILCWTAFYISSCVTLCKNYLL